MDKAALWRRKSGASRIVLMNVGGGGGDSGGYFSRLDHLAFT